MLIVSVAILGIQPHVPRIPGTDLRTIISEGVSRDRPVVDEDGVCGLQVRGAFFRPSRPDSEGLLHHPSAC